MIIQPMTTSSLTPTGQEISGVARLDHLGVIRATGPDAATFLQGQLTQDVVSIGQDTARLAAFCNAKGRMQASFVVFKHQNADAVDELLMVCSADILALNSVAGGARAPWSKLDIAGQNVVVLYPGAGSERALCCSPSHLAPPQGVELPLTTWQWLEVQAGIAMISLPIYEAFVPQMLNYESVGGVNFKKGCYPGQEVVARSQFRGTLKRRAFVVHASNDRPEPMHIGQEVFHSSDSEQPCGLVAACAANPCGGFDAIVSMQTSSASNGTLTLGSANGAALIVLPLPYPLLEDI